MSTDNCGVAGTLGNGALVSNDGSSICSLSVNDISDLASLKIEGVVTEEAEAEMGMLSMAGEAETSDDVPGCIGIPTGGRPDFTGEVDFFALRGDVEVRLAPGGPFESALSSLP